MVCENGVIEQAEHSEGEFISQIFIRPKKNGKYRIILNLKEHNLSSFSKWRIFTWPQLSCVKIAIWHQLSYRVHTIHFPSMKNTGSTRGSCHVEWVTVPVHLPAKWLVFGASSVYKITKLLYASLRAQGHLSVGHIDDSLIVIYKGKARLSAMIRCRLQRKHLIMCVFASTRTSLSKQKQLKDWISWALHSVQWQLRWVLLLTEPRKSNRNAYTCWTSNVFPFKN